MDSALVLPDFDRYVATIALESIKHFGPQKFRELLDSKLTPQEVLKDPSQLSLRGKRVAYFRDEISKLTAKGLSIFEERAERQLIRAQKFNVNILLHGDHCYPPNLWNSNNPVPILYAIGDVSLLKHQKAVACVGSRTIDECFGRVARDFAAFAASTGWTVTSGFAVGADTIAHRAAKDVGGETICVMPSGLDRPFPPENRDFWKELVSYPNAVLVSEFSLGTPAGSLNLRKRNKTIVGMSLGVFVGQSSVTGGAMNAFRFAMEQKKSVATIEPTNEDSTSGNQLIVAEGGRCFPASESAERNWQEWLSELSYSI